MALHLIQYFREPGFASRSKRTNRSMIRLSQLTNPMSHVSCPCLCELWVSTPRARVHRVLVSVYSIVPTCFNTVGWSALLVASSEWTSSDASSAIGHVTVRMSSVTAKTLIRSCGLLWQSFRYSLHMFMRALTRLTGLGPTCAVNINTSETL